jgi:methylenetetrahydrofolate reductase (NADPH)
MAVCELLDRIMDCPVMPHLTCVGAGRDELEEVIDEIYDKSFRNIMALRGDPPKGETTFTPAPDGLRYAAELVQMIDSRHPEICCGVAGYPEVHPEAESAETDAMHLKEKLDAGGRFVTTQLFFENHYYFDYVERCRALGITQPILPGLLPAVSLGQLERVMTLSQSAFPEELAEQLRAAGGKGPKAQAVGIEWTIRQIDELIAHGAPGAHLYIFNRAQTALYPPLAACIQKHRNRR